MVYGIPVRVATREAIAAWRAFLSADGVGEAADVAARYGWLPPFLGILVQGVLRGVISYLTQPLPMAARYVFPGWPVMLGISLTLSFFAALLLWFLYFGIAGGTTATVTGNRSTMLAVLKFGGYASVVFVPLLLIGVGLAWSIPSAEVLASSGLESAINNGQKTDPAAVASAIRDANDQIRRTPQFRQIHYLRSVGWILTGVITTPALARLYDVSTRFAALVVTPITLLAAVFPLLLI